MYLSASPYNHFIPESRVREKTQKARYGKSIFFSVLLHLVLFFCFISINKVSGGYPLQDENAVEVNIVSFNRPARPVESGSDINRIEVVKPLPGPVSVTKKEIKPEVMQEKKPETPLILEKVIDPLVKNNETRSINPAEATQHNTLAGSIPDNNEEEVSEQYPVSYGLYGQNSEEISEEYSQAPASAGFSASQGKNYVDENFYYVKDLITSNLIYPAVARRMKWQGTVEVSFKVLETGMVENIKIVASSGHSILDANVVTAIQHVQPFPPPPVVAEFTMPIKYVLRPE
ncbi:MAG: energy transducer TonB [Deltaproteobacteria bacterium]|nr:energy transducer TonB [Deltaproteobacteria bacterium]